MFTALSKDDHRGEEVKVINILVPNNGYSFTLWTHFLFCGKFLPHTQFSLLVSPCFSNLHISTNYNITPYISTDRPVCPSLSNTVSV